MAKILRRCADCAHYRQQMHGGKWKCEKAGFRFRDSFSPDTIADSCPLDDVPDAPRWVPVSSGEKPPAMQRVVVLAGGLVHIALLVRHRQAETGSDWGRVDELGYWQGVTHWLAGMPPLPKEGSGDQ